MRRVDIQLADALVRLTGASRSELTSILAEPWAYYRRAPIPKKDGTFRVIRAPSESLKAIQRELLRRRLSALDVHPASHCRSRRSIITNARKHQHQRYVSAYDLHAAFPSTTPRMVREALLREGFDPTQANAIKELCTLRGELPQGAPTSPALLSIVLRSMDDALGKEASRQGLVYTRYMDDLFVSGDRRSPSFDRVLRDQVERAGYRLARDKIRRWGPTGRRPTLTGIVLGSSLAPTQEFATSVAKMVRDVEAGTVRLTENERRSLEGRIAFVQALSPGEGMRLRARLVN